MGFMTAAGVILGVGSSVLGVGSASASTPRPTYFSSHGHHHSCSYTRPEYMLADDGMNVRTYPGTARFTAWHPAGQRWKDAYWVSGWHDQNSSICARREVPGTKGAHARSLEPGIVGASRITANLHVVQHGHGRVGFDLWMTASTREHTPTQMEHDSRTYEIMVQPGRWSVQRQFVGWHRIFVSDAPGRWNVFNRSGLNLTAVVRTLGVPAWYHWGSIEAGAENTSGSFTVYGYSLHISPAHHAIRHHVVRHHRVVRHHHRVVRHHARHHHVVRHHRAVRHHRRHR